MVHASDLFRDLERVEDAIFQFALVSVPDALEDGTPSRDLALVHEMVITQLRQLRRAELRLHQHIVRFPVIPPGRVVA